MARASLAWAHEFREAPDVSLDFDTYFDALEACSTFVKVRGAVPIDEGWDNFVMEVNGEWIVRFPRDESQRLRLARELALLERIAGSLPTRVPLVEHRGDPEEGAAPRFSAHRKTSRREFAI